MGSGFIATLEEIAGLSASEVRGRLAEQAAERSLSATPESLMAWAGSLHELRKAWEYLRDSVPESASWTVLLEYEIPRREKRIDVTILMPHTIVPVEMKVGAEAFGRAERWQAERYALDLRDFHVESKGRRIAPVLVATGMDELASTPVGDRPTGVLPLACCGGGALGHYLEFVSGLPAFGVPIDAAAWNHSGYQATPTIVQAARTLYEGHDVRNISTADAINLSGTVEAVIELVQRCRTEGRRGIAFITGAPGSGKTLAGLQVVHDERLEAEGGSSGVFLSGNRPLVEVIRKALANVRVPGLTTDERTRRLGTFIQHAYSYRNLYAEDLTQVPPEHVVLFDEAQRAWDEERVRSWSRGVSTRSEPQIFLDVMSRVPEWCVVIAMVGGGQEINRGEAGLAEWGRTLLRDHPNWLIAAPRAVLPGAPSRPGGTLFGEGDGVQVSGDERLHLKMNVRSPRAERLNLWVDAVLDQRIADAAVVLPNEGEFPMALTRDLDVARQWLRDRAAADERYGLLASSSDRRLMAWGLDTHTLQRENEWANWFLAPIGDVRSSCQLEVPATQFDCQGLELDWSGVCWGSDLTPEGGDWRTRAFVGTKWQNRHGSARQFLINGYRVLLTRARRGQVIWVPAAKPGDASLNADYLDATADLLQRAGVPLLD